MLEEATELERAPMASTTHAGRLSSDVERLERAPATENSAGTKACPSTIFIDLAHGDFQTEPMI